MPLFFYRQKSNGKIELNEKTKTLLGSAISHIMGFVLQLKITDFGEIQRLKTIISQSRPSVSGQWLQWQNKIFSENFFRSSTASKYIVAIMKPDKMWCNWQTFTWILLIGCCDYQLQYTQNNANIRLTILKSHCTALHCSDFMHSVPWKVFLPVDLIVAEVKSVFFHQPRALSKRVTPTAIPSNFKSVETFSFFFPLHGAQEICSAPEVGFESPAEIITFLERTSAKITVLGGAPNDQRQWGVVGEAIDDTNLVFYTEDVLVRLDKRDDNYA